MLTLFLSFPKRYQIQMSWSNSTTRLTPIQPHLKINNLSSKVDMMKKKSELQ